MSEETKQANGTEEVKDKTLVDFFTDQDQALISSTLEQIDDEQVLQIITLMSDKFNAFTKYQSAKISLQMKEVEKYNEKLLELEIKNEILNNTVLKLERQKNELETKILVAGVNRD